MTAPNPGDTESAFENQVSPRTEPRIGPSDSSDTASEMPAKTPDTDSDREATGERASVDLERDRAGDDVQPDKVVSEDDAALARTPPDPVNNGGLSD